MAIDDEAFLIRAEGISARTIVERLHLEDASAYFSLSRKTGEIPRSAPVDLDVYPGLTVRWKREVTEPEKTWLKRQVLAEMTYSEKLEFSKRPEEIDAKLYQDIWEEVNAHLGTSAYSHAELVEQLGIMPFGRRPKVADTFCGGGSIPFEAARLGCDVYASDLNPIACMLTWGALNIIGADEDARAEIEAAQRQVAEAVDREVTALGIEHDNEGNRAKAYLYCLETRCPETGWWVPMAPSWVISKTHRIYAKLIPNRATRRFDIEVVTGASAAERKAAEKGTVQEGYLVYELDGELHRTAIKTIRGDYARQDGVTGNRLRLWQKSDFKPHPDDIFQERLYCIQWTCSRYDRAKDKLETWTEFRSVSADDLARETKVENLVAKNLATWQQQGLVPDMAIEPGEKTDEPIRTRGWTHWHHLFNARQLLLMVLYIKNFAAAGQKGEYGLLTAKLLDKNNRLCRWIPGSRGPSNPGGNSDQITSIFYNQAYNTLYTYGCRSFGYNDFLDFKFGETFATNAIIAPHSANRP